MDYSTSTPASHTFSEKVLRAILLGTLAVLGFYLSLLSGIVKIGMALIRKVPLGNRPEKV